jgi:uncharacterized membrane protein
MRRVILALALTACASPPQELPPPLLPQRAGVDATVALRAEGVRYLAIGEEQFVLRIYDDRISFARAGQDELNFPQTEPLYPRWNGEIYETEANGHRLRLEIRRRGECADKNGRDTVAVTLDGAAMMGCGRAY